MRDEIFISYSHKDSRFLTELRSFLAPFERKHKIVVWDDTRIKLGEQWEQQIETALSRARFAILLMSNNFLSSRFVTEYELPKLLKAQAADGLKIIWVPLTASGVEATEIQRYQAAHDPVRPLDVLRPAQRRAAWARIVNDLFARFNEVQAGALEPGPHGVSETGAGNQLHVDEHSHKAGLPIGTMRLDDPCYVKRPADTALVEAVWRFQDVINVTGYRQTGKTLLVAHCLKKAKDHSIHCIYSDLQKFDGSDMASLESFYKRLCEDLKEQLKLSFTVSSVWEAHLSANLNFERILRRIILTQQPKLIWAIDEIDRLFSVPFGQDFFRLVRSIHDRLVFNEFPSLSLILAHVSHPSRFITPITESPYNVGRFINVRDFSFQEFCQMNKNYGSPLKNTRHLKSFYSLIGGHPFLSRCGLHQLAAGDEAWPGLARTAALEIGPFGNHLRGLLGTVSRNTELRTAIKMLLAKKTVDPESRIFEQLELTGIVVRLDGEPKIRCRLYESYFSKVLAR